jgi:hypothetical protein
MRGYATTPSAGIAAHAREFSSAFACNLANLLDLANPTVSKYPQHSATEREEI